MMQSGKVRRGKPMMWSAQTFDQLCLAGCDSIDIIATSQEISESGF